MRARILFLFMAVLLLLPLLSFADGEAAVASVDATSWIVGKDPDAYAPHRMIDEDETTAFQFSTKTTPLGQEYLIFYLGGPSTVNTLWIKNRTAVTRSWFPRPTSVQDRRALSSGRVTERASA